VFGYPRGLTGLVLRNFDEQARAPAGVRVRLRARFDRLVGQQSHVDQIQQGLVQIVRRRQPDGVTVQIPHGLGVRVLKPFRYDESQHRQSIFQTALIRVPVRAPPYPVVAHQHQDGLVQLAGSVEPVEKRLQIVVAETRILDVIVRQARRPKKSHVRVVGHGRRDPIRVVEQRGHA